MCVSLNFNSELFLVPYLYVFICLSALFAYFAHSKTEEAPRVINLFRWCFVVLFSPKLCREKQKQKKKTKKKRDRRGTEEETRLC